MKRRRLLTTVLTVLLLPLTMAFADAKESIKQDTVKTEVELTTKEMGAKENALGNTVADAIRTSAKSDVALIASSFFTDISPIAKGNVDMMEILKALDFKSDTIVIMKLTGNQIIKGLEHGLYLYPKTNSGFLHFSGMTVTIRGEMDKESRVISVKIDKEDLDKEKTYKVAMPAPLANGTLAYFKIWKKTDIDKDTEKTLESVVTEYLKNNKTIKSQEKGEERLVVKEK